MISEILKRWIAQSESWQTFVDFKLPEGSIARYPFLTRPDDFYISLFGSLYEVLDDPETEKEKILSIAKGLEIYSLENKRENFKGINQSDNILFAAGLYYLADYSSSASILAKIYSFEDYETDIEKFLLSFLSRKKLEHNIYRSYFDRYLETGEIIYLRTLLKRIKINKEYYFKYEPNHFIMYYLAEAILTKFENNNIWVDLLRYNNAEYWREYISAAIDKKFPIWDFFPSQKLALEKGILEDYQSIALQTPTSSGKTAISELLIFDELKHSPNSKILYLAPFRALACELKQSFCKHLDKLGISSKTIYGGDIPTTEEKKAIQDVHLLISTPEKFMAIENIQPDFSNNFTMIICDEGHLLDDEGNRGLSYELLLSRLKKEKNKKFIFLSAIAPNIAEINKWLGGDEEHVVESDYRATEIEYAFLKPSEYYNNSFVLEVNPLSEFPRRYILNNFLTTADLSYIKHLKTKDKDKIDETYKSKSAIIALKALRSGSVALFTPSKGGDSGVMGLAKEVIKQIENKSEVFNELNLQKKTQDKNELKEYFQVIFGDDYLLTQAVDYGFLFHHGDLPQNVREVVEDYVRRGGIKLIISTNTLAEGVNLPIKTMVINSTKRFNYETNRWDDLKSRDLKNLFGRAGRAGQETKGLIIIPNPRDFGNVEKVIRGDQIEEISGSLYRIIRFVASKKLQLTPEILRGLNSDKDKEIIDTIDIAIIDLLGEEVDAEGLEEEIMNLINETFASFQSNIQEKETLDNLISFRGREIKSYVEKGEFAFLKRSGATPRIYDELENKLDLDNPMWSELENPSEDRWMDFIIDIVSELSVVKYQFKRFNKYNLKKEEQYLSFNDVKAAMKCWLEGGWYDDVLDVCPVDIDTSLKIINHFIGYNLQTAISSVVHIVELKLKKEEKIISPVILNFPQYLLYGLQNQFQLDLIEIGFTDRIGIIELSKIFENKIGYSELSELKYLLNDNREVLMSVLEKSIPKISLEKMEKSFDYLRYGKIL